jgi:hypothetical protein
MLSVVLPNRFPFNHFTALGLEDGFALVLPKHLAPALKQEEKYILRAGAWAMGKREKNMGWFYREDVFPHVSNLLKRCQQEPAEACFDAWLLFDNTPAPPPFARGPFDRASLRKPLQFSDLFELPEQPAPLNSHGCKPAAGLALPCLRCGRGAGHG